ncbi:hypothetical protein OF001_U20092 [Pseudomonas sp. OF001]|nr:hypothetical protein OF001_U20092 [Pseudomonas sp. OF001]
MSLRMCLRHFATLYTMGFYYWKTCHTCTIVSSETTHPHPPEPADQRGVALAHQLPPHTPVGYGGDAGRTRGAGYGPIVQAASIGAGPLGRQPRGDVFRTSKRTTSGSNSMILPASSRR